MFRRSTERPASHSGPDALVASRSACEAVVLEATRYLKDNWKRAPLRAKLRAHVSIREAVEILSDGANNVDAGLRPHFIIAYHHAAGRVAEDIALCMEEEAGAGAGDFLH